MIEESCGEVPIKIIFLMVINWFLLLESGKSLDYKIAMMKNYLFENFSFLPNLVKISAIANLI